WWSGTLREGGESVERCSELVSRGRAGPCEAVLVGQLGPVVGAGDPRARCTYSLKIPSPQMPWLLLPRLGRLPGNAAALVELDHVILPDAAISEGHHEHLTRATDALPGGCPGQVFVAVPVWLPGGISD